MWIFGTIKAKIRKSVCAIMEEIANDIRKKYNLV